MSMFPTNILVAIDGSDSSDPALRAVELSEKTGSEMNVIYVGKDVPAPAGYNELSSSDQEAAQKAQELLDEKARQVKEAGGRVAESYVVLGDDPADKIFEFTKELDIGLVVVGIREVVIEFDNGDEDVFRPRMREEFGSYELQQLAVYIETLSHDVKKDANRLA